MEPREVTLHGHRLSYRAGGSGPLLVLIHGITASAATWDEVLPWLAERHTVVAPDLFGHGRSAKPRSIVRSEEHTSELQSRLHLVCRLLLEKKKKERQHKNTTNTIEYVQTEGLTHTS